MKRNDKMKEFQNLTTEEINKKIAENKEELLNEKIIFAIGNIGGDGMKLVEYFKGKEE